MVVSIFCSEYYEDPHLGMWTGKHAHLYIHVPGELLNRLDNFRVFLTFFFCFKILQCYEFSPSFYTEEKDFPFLAHELNYS